MNSNISLFSGLYGYVVAAISSAFCFMIIFSVLNIKFTTLELLMYSVSLSIFILLICFTLFSKGVVVVSDNNNEIVVSRYLLLKRVKISINKHSSLVIKSNFLKNENKDLLNELFENISTGGFAYVELFNNNNFVFDSTLVWDQFKLVGILYILEKKYKCKFILEEIG